MPRDYATILFAIVFAVGAVTILFFIYETIRDIVVGLQHRKVLRRRMREIKETAPISRQHAVTVAKGASR